jgi:hypothetical protein
MTLLLLVGPHRHTQSEVKQMMDEVYGAGQRRRSMVDVMSQCVAAAAAVVQPFAGARRNQTN